MGWRQQEAPANTPGDRGVAEGAACCPASDTIPPSPARRSVPRAALRQEKGSSAWVAGRGCGSAELWTPSDDPVLSGESRWAVVSEGKAAGGEKNGPWRRVRAGGQSPSAGASWSQLSPAPCPPPAWGDPRALGRQGKDPTCFLTGFCHLHWALTSRKRLVVYSKPQGRLLLQSYAELSGGA